MDNKLEEINRLLESKEEFNKYLETIEEQKIEIPQGLNEKIINNIKVINNINKSVSNSSKNTTVKLTKPKRL